MPGTRILRVWKSERHEVHVTETGYLWRGKDLSLALGDRQGDHRRRRNGPAFFGLRDGGAAMTRSAESRKQVRCAIYTRKSTEEGLEQEFNSLDAQREACAAYILSQKHEGWTALPDLLRRWRLLRRLDGAPGPAGAARRHRRPARSTWWSSTRSTG